MPDRDLRDVADPLSKTTRAERKWLLVSAFGIVVLSWGGLVPTRISAFGVEIGASKAMALVVLTMAICIYFLCTFIVYYRSDRFATEDFLAHHEAEISDAFFSEMKEKLGALEDGGKTQGAVRQAFRHTFKRFFRVRYGFEFWSAVSIASASLVAGSIWLVLKLTVKS